MNKNVTNFGTGTEDKSQGQKENVLKWSYNQGELYEKVMAIELPDEITTFEIVGAYLRAALVAADVVYDLEFYKHLMLEIAKAPHHTKPSKK